VCSVCFVVQVNTPPSLSFQPRKTRKTRNELQEHRRLLVVTILCVFRVIRVFGGSIQHPSAIADFNHESHEIHETNRKTPLPLSFQPRKTWNTRNESQKQRRLLVVSNPAVFRGSTPDTTDATCLQSHVWPHYLIWHYVRTRHLDPCLPNVRPCHSPDGYNDCASSRDGAGHLPSITEYAGTARVLSSYISS
jgi:hypothetical protein